MENTFLLAVFMGACLWCAAVGIIKVWRKKTQLPPYLANGPTYSHVKFYSFRFATPKVGAKMHVLDRYGNITVAVYRGPWQLDYWIENGYWWAFFPATLYRKTDLIFNQ